MNKKWWAALLAAVGIGASAAVATADNVNLEVMQQGDSVRVVAKWSPRCDVRGCPDSYRVRWLRGNTQLPERTLTRRADTTWFAMPAINDSVQVGISVVAVRRNQTSTPVIARRWIVNRDAAPLPVDSLAIDTLALVDSVQIVWLAANNVASVEAPLLREGDSVRVAARYFLVPGSSRRAKDSTTWRVVPPATGVLTVRAYGVPMRDTAWLKAVSCGCVESRDAVLDVPSGQWVVRVADGSVRAATPVNHAEPFRRRASE